MIQNIFIEEWERRFWLKVIKMTRRIEFEISRINRHLESARNISKQNMSDAIIFGALSMELFQAINAAIDLGEEVVTLKHLGYPSKYTETFDILLSKGVIKKDCANALKRLVYLRNLISHEYHQITDKELKEIMKLSKFIEELIESIKKSLK